MLVRKRNGSREPFDKNKIRNAIVGANGDTKKCFRVPEGFIDDIVNNVCDSICANVPFNDFDCYTVDIEQIQDAVEHELQTQGYYDLAKHYMIYRYERKLVREIKQRDEGILKLLDGENEELNVENSNKDVRLITTMRDYMAGEVSKDIVNLMYDKDILEADRAGVIHLHDQDYISCRINNCGLVNLEDMLQNGTNINGTMIEKPHSFRTACTIVTQIVAIVASSQYGGQTITLSHLAPFVDISRNKIREDIYNEINKLSCHIDDTSLVDKIVEERVREEVKNGIQTLQYQLITLNSTNGQAPFVTVFMDINEVPDGQTRNDLVMIIEEMLKQRIAGVKNEKGAYITVAFPKLIYCLDDNNASEDSKYWWLTRLAAECSSKRLVPDYISAKKMKELKGDVYPCINKICA